MCSCSSEDYDFPDEFFPTKLADAYILMEQYGKEYECVCCHQTIGDPFKEDYTTTYNSFMATYILARAFKFAVRQIAIIFDRESLGEYLSLSLLERRIQKAEKAEQIVKALEKDAGDEEHQKAIEIIKQCKKLPVIVREWPLRKEDVNYFIESMDTIVAILKLLCEGEDLCKVSLVNEWFCKTETGWHKPPSFSQVNLL